MGGKAHNGRRVSWEEGMAIVERFRPLLGDTIESLKVCGSLRRKKATAGDVDVVLLPKPNMEMVIGETLRRLWGSQINGKPKHSGLLDGVQIDVSVTTADQWGANVLFLTGSWEHNVVMRQKAKSMGLLLNEKGLYKAVETVVKGKVKRSAGEWVAGRTEEDVFEALGLPYVAAENREVAAVEMTEEDAR